jgi:hypothetical protein
MAKKPYIWAERPTVLSAMRKAFRRYPPYQEVLKRNKSVWYQECKNGKKRKRVHFQCEECDARVSAKEYAVDHKYPVIDPSVGFVDYNTYARRLFCPIENLQGLCYACHKEKCRLETKERAKSRKEKKNV